MGKFLSLMFCFCVTMSSIASADQKSAGYVAVKHAFNSYYNYELLRRVANKCSKIDFLEKVDSTVLERELRRVLKIDIEQFYDYLLTVSYNIELLNKQQELFECTNPRHLSHLDSLLRQHRQALGFLAKSEPLPKPLPKLNYSVGKSKSMADRQIQASLINGLAEAHSIAIGTILRTDSVPKSEQKVYFKHSSRPEFVYRLDKGWKNKMDHYIPVVENEHGGFIEHQLDQEFLIIIKAPKNAFKTYEAYRAFLKSSVEPHLFLLGETHWNW